MKTEKEQNTNTAEDCESTRKADAKPDSKLQKLLLNPRILHERRTKLF